MVIVSGVFIQNPDSRVDMLIVGDKIKKNKVENEIRKLEAEIGSELTYAVFDTKEFSYRLNMYDKLTRKRSRNSPEKKHKRLSTKTNKTQKKQSVCSVKRDNKDNKRSRAKTVRKNER